MEFFINGQKIDITLEGETSLSKILQGIEDWCVSSELIINRLIIDEKDIFYSITDENIPKDISGIKRVDIESVTYFEYAFNSFVGIVEYINNICQSEVNVSGIKDVVEGIEFITESIPRTTFLLNISLDKYDILDQMKMLEARCERMKELSKSPNEALKFFKEEIQVYLKEKFINTLLLMLEETHANLLLSFTRNITSENILYRIGSLKSFTQPLVEILEQMVSYLQTGNDKNAFNLVEKFSKSIESIFHIISKALYLYNIETNDVEFEGTTLTVFIDDINNNMKNIIEAFHNEDYVSIADIFEYEIKDRIILLSRYINLIEKMIEKKLAAT